MAWMAWMAWKEKVPPIRGSYLSPAFAVTTQKVNTQYYQPETETRNCGFCQLKTKTNKYAVWKIKNKYSVYI